MRREAVALEQLPSERRTRSAPSPIFDVADAGPARPHYRYAVIPRRRVFCATNWRPRSARMRSWLRTTARWTRPLVRTTVTPAARMAYVSYRIGNRVFWTRKPVRIPAGETLLTDGETEIRARCGNAVSDIAREPVSDVEPMAAELDEPISDDSSINGERDLVGAAPYVPFLLPAQGAILGNDAPDLPAELHALGGGCRCWPPCRAGQARRSSGSTTPARRHRGDESDERVEGGAAILEPAAPGREDRAVDGSDTGSAGDAGWPQRRSDRRRWIQADPGSGPARRRSWTQQVDTWSRRGRGRDSGGGGTRHAGATGSGSCRGGRATPAARTRFAGADRRAEMVGATGFEPATSRSRTERSTRLSHAPTERSVYL